jgi:hypothetical protein
MAGGGTDLVGEARVPPEVIARLAEAEIGCEPLRVRLQVGDGFASKRMMQRVGDPSPLAGDLPQGRKGLGIHKRNSSCFTGQKPAHRFRSEARVTLDRVTAARLATPHADDTAGLPSSDQHLIWLL